jgi:hypothetical protein
MEGLYPQSHIVVADQPLAEIAARTWIDEYAKLDRSLLLKRPKHTWFHTTTVSRELRRMYRRLSRNSIVHFYRTHLKAIEGKQHSNGFLGNDSDFGAYKTRRPSR